MNDQASIFQFSGWWSWPRGRIHWLFYTKWMIMLPFLISPFNKKSNVWKVTTSHFWEKILTLKFLSLVFSPYLCSQLPTALLVASGLCGTVHGPAAGGFFLMFCLTFLLSLTSFYFSLLFFTSLSPIYSLLWKNKSAGKETAAGFGALPASLVSFWGWRGRWCCNIPTLQNKIIKK